MGVESVDQAARRNIAPSARRRPFWGYIGLVSVSGTALLVGSLLRFAPSQADLVRNPGFWILTALVVFGEVRPIFTPGLADPNGVTPSTTFAFAALIALGGAPAALLQALAAIVTALVRRSAWWRGWFNAAQYTVSVLAAWSVLALTGHQASPGRNHLLDNSDLLPIALAAVVYFVVNNLLVSIAVALLEGDSVRATFTDDLGYQIIVNVALLGIAPLVAVVLTGAWVFLPLFLLPLTAFHMTARLSVERERQALHDALTGLANRKLLTRRAAEEVRNARQRGTSLALLVLDLDEFKEINDTLGHPAGDRVLTIVAERLRASVRPHDEVARLGGDEFAVLLPEVRDAAAAREVANRLHEALEVPFEVDGFLIDVGAASGIALFPEHGDDYDVLFARADMAMYVAKEERTRIEVYDPARDRHSAERLSLLVALRRAPEHDEFVLHYQPKIELATGRPCGVEALVRWNHPTQGLLMPNAFVPVAEQYGLTGPLTDKVLAMALDQAVVWRAQGFDLPVAVNVSARDLRDVTFARRVLSALAERGLPVSALHLEMTESAFTADLVRVHGVLGDLSDSGVQLSLDDFGTGYSSLTRLRAFPFGEVKIDQSFVAALVDQGEDATIVRSVIELGHGLGLRVVAEGIENELTSRLLIGLGCDIGQGYHFARPMPAPAVTAWITERLAAPSSSAAVTS